MENSVSAVKFLVFPDNYSVCTKDSETLFTWRKMMKNMVWAFTIVLAGLAGIFMLEYLVSAPKYMYLFLALSLLSMIAACILIATRFEKNTATLAAILGPAWLQLL